MRRNIALDWFKFALAFTVVGIHCHFLESVNPLADALTSNGFFRVAVPCFLTINGFYFFEAEQSGKIATWLRHIAVLYISWMLIYSPMWSLGRSPLAILSTCIVGYHHLWYLSALFVAGLMLRKLTVLPSRGLAYIAIVLYLVGAAMQGVLAAQFAGGGWIGMLAHRNFLFIGLPFLALGYLANREKVSEKVSRRFLGVLIVLSTLFLGLEVFAHHLNGSASQLDNLGSLIILAPALTLLVMKSQRCGDGKRIALMSSAVYLIHPVLVTCIERYNLHSVVLTGTVFAGAVVCSLVIVAARKKLPWLV